MTDAHIREIEEPAAAPADKPAEKEDWKSFGKFLVKLVVVVLIFRTFFFTSFNIPSESMMPRLLVGDYLFSQKWSYGFSHPFAAVRNATLAMAAFWRASRIAATW